MRSVFPAGLWLVVISLAMQSNGAPGSETSPIYCEALITASSTADDNVKTLAATSTQQHVQPYPTSHLVTNRSYTASKLTSDYVSEVSDVRPCEMAVGIISPAKSESKVHLEHPVDHNAANRQKKGSTNVDSNGAIGANYVTFIHPSCDSSSRTASTLESAKPFESPLLARKQRTSVKNDSLYSEIKGQMNDDANDNHYTDVLTAPISASEWKQIVNERDLLLQHVSRLTTEKQDVVYKLRDFVTTNGELHGRIAELQNKLQEVELSLEREQHEKALLISRLTELTSAEHYVTREMLPNDSQKLTLEGASANTGDDSFISSNQLHSRK